MNSTPSTCHPIHPSASMQATPSLLSPTPSQLRNCKSKAPLGDSLSPKFAYCSEGEGVTLPTMRKDKGQERRHQRWKEGILPVTESRISSRGSSMSPFPVEGRRRVPCAISLVFLLNYRKENVRRCPQELAPGG